MMGLKMPIKSRDGRYVSKKPQTMEMTEAD
jgi:hypothetical protein